MDCSAAFDVSQLPRTYNVLGSTLSIERPTSDPTDTLWGFKVGDLQFSESVIVSRLSSGRGGIASTSGADQMKNEQFHVQFVIVI